MRFGRRLLGRILAGKRSQAEQLGDNYVRFATNRLRDDFGLPGVPIRMT
jgi:predicted GTPase